MTEGTIKVYLHALFEKLGVSSRTELAMLEGLDFGEIDTNQDGVISREEWESASEQ